MDPFSAYPPTERHPLDDHPLGRSFGGFFLLLLVGLISLSALVLWGFGAILLAAAVLLLLLPFGIDTRVAGWLVASAIPVAAASVTLLNEGTPTCMPRDHVTDGCLVHLETGWLIGAASLVVAGLLMLAVAIGRRRSLSPIP